MPSSVICEYTIGNSTREHLKGVFRQKKYFQVLTNHDTSFEVVRGCSGGTKGSFQHSFITYSPIFELGMVANDLGGVRDLILIFISSFNIHFLIRHFRSLRDLISAFIIYFNIHFLIRILGRTELGNVQSTRDGSEISFQQSFSISTFISLFAFLVARRWEKSQSTRDGSEISFQRSLPFSPFKVAQSQEGSALTREGSVISLPHSFSFFLFAI